MFYVLENSDDSLKSPATGAIIVDNIDALVERESDKSDYSASDIDIVDDALLNTAPHNTIERQLLTGDMVGLALMSGAIIWSAMGAFG